MPLLPRLFLDVTPFRRTTLRGVSGSHSELTSVASAAWAVRAPGGDSSLRPGFMLGTVQSVYTLILMYVSSQWPRKAGLPFWFPTLASTDHVTCSGGQLTRWGLGCRTPAPSRPTLWTGGHVGGAASGPLLPGGWAGPAIPAGQAQEHGVRSAARLLVAG